MSNICLSLITNKVLHKSAAELFNRECTVCLQSNQKGFLLRESGILPLSRAAEKNADIAKVSRIKFPKKRCGSATETDNAVLEVYTSSRLPAFSEEYRKEKIYKYMGFSELKFWLLR